MRRCARLAASVALALVLSAAGRTAAAQPWAVDVSAGRLDYVALPADLGAAHLLGTLRYEAAPWNWVYGGGALPLGPSDPLWTMAGAGARWWPARLSRPGAALGLDVHGEGFLFRDRLVGQNGSGASVDLLPFARLNAGTRAHVDVRAGWRGHTLSQAGVTTRRGVLETGARLTRAAVVQLEADVRVVHADTTAYPFVGGAIQVGRAQSAQVRLHGGRWVGGGLSDMGWGAGLALPLGSQGTLWASVRQDTPDPLYWNSARRTWSVGLTRRLGRATSPLPAITAPGMVTIRLAARDAGDGTVSVAGDFNGWTPAPMRREEDAWVLRLPLSAGVYHYAFRAADGRWFVPASIAGRRADGFGGHVAVLVVS